MVVHNEEVCRLTVAIAAAVVADKFTDIDLCFIPIGTSLRIVERNQQNQIDMFEFIMRHSNIGN